METAELVFIDALIDGPFVLSGVLVAGSDVGLELDLSHHLVLAVLLRAYQARVVELLRI